LKRHILGQPAAIRRAYERSLAATEYIGQEGVAMWGVAAVDIELWDLLNRRLGVAAALLFGRLANLATSTRLQLGSAKCRSCNGRGCRKCSIAQCGSGVAKCGPHLSPQN
jgi:hypothetical protein